MRLVLIGLSLLFAWFPAPMAAQEPHPCETVASPELAQMLLDTRSDQNDFTEYDPDGDGIACEPDELAAAGQPPTALVGGTCDLQSLAQADPSARTTLDGRLGGTVASFDTTYGPSSGSDLFPEYIIPGCGAVLVSDYGGSIVVTVHVFAPREGEDQDYFEPDEADWTISEAMKIAESFLPADTVLDAPLGDMNPPAPGMLADEIEVRGWSQTLVDNVPAAAWDYVDNTPTYGGFSYWLMRTFSGDVSQIIVELEIED